MPVYIYVCISHPVNQELCFTAYRKQFGCSLNMHYRRKERQTLRGTHRILFWLIRQRSKGKSQCENIRGIHDFYVRLWGMGGSTNQLQTQCASAELLQFLASRSSREIPAQCGTNWRTVWSLHECIMSGIRHHMVESGQVSVKGHNA